MVTMRPASSAVRIALITAAQCFWALMSSAHRRARCHRLHPPPLTPAVL